MPMLERIHIENYKCLREVTVQLGDFTILIGPNDSGKSSFLDVIESLGKIPTQSLQQLFSGDKALSNLVWRKQKDRKIVWEVFGEAYGDAFVYRIVLPVNEQPPTEGLEFGGKKLLWTESEDSSEIQ